MPNEGGCSIPPPPHTMALFTIAKKGGASLVSTVDE